MAMKQMGKDAWIVNWLVIVGVVAGSCAIAPTTPAQIIPDNTLPTPSSVEPGCTICTIEGGVTQGDNLFHSFSEFSIPRGGEAFFNNASQIENIFSRVTGNSISDIDGLIRANGVANLFLINPNGIIFGPNAQLNVGGSFLASTADSLIFEDGFQFSATNPNLSPLLTVTTPFGLQYGANPGGIRVQGPGNNLRRSPLNLETIRDDRPAGLQVAAGRTLALIGGEVGLEGGNLTAADGRIELGSVAGGSLVTLAPTNPGWTFGYGGVEQFQEIRLTQAASVDTSGSGGGDIQIQGRRILLSEGSAIVANTLADQSGGTVTVNASESVELIGAGEPFLSSLVAEVATGASGDGVNLTLRTNRLSLVDGGAIAIATFGSGNTGDLTVRAQVVEAIGSSPNPVVSPFPFFRSFPSGLGANVAPGAIGNAQNVTLETNQLRIVDGAQIGATTFGAGSAGVLTVRAQSVEIVGTNALDPFSPTGLFAQADRGSTGDEGGL